MAIGSSHFWVRRLESSILLLKKYPEFLNIPTILGRYHYNIYSMMDLSYQEIYHNLPLKLRQNWMLWDTRICNSWINGWPHFTFIYTVLIYIYIHTPYAPCMEYLPTFTRTKSPSFVGKYTFYEAYGYIYIYINKCPWNCWFHLFIFASKPLPHNNSHVRSSVHQFWWRIFTHGKTSTTNVVSLS